MKRDFCSTLFHVALFGQKAVKGEYAKSSIEKKIDLKIVVTVPIFITICLFAFIHKILL